MLTSFWLSGQKDFGLDLEWEIVVVKITPKQIISQ